MRSLIWGNSHIGADYLEAHAYMLFACLPYVRFRVLEPYIWVLGRVWYISLHVHTHHTFIPGVPLAQAKHLQVGALISTSSCTVPQGQIIQHIISFSGSLSQGSFAASFFRDPFWGVSFGSDSRRGESLKDWMNLKRRLLVHIPYPLGTAPTH